ALGIEQRRLTDESRRRADELAALHATSQLITARLDVASGLDRISLSVPALIGASGCGIGLFNSERTHVVQAAAYGVQSEEWRTLSVPVGEGIIGRVAAEGIAIRVADVQSDARSARREVDEREGIRSMLCVPLKVVGVVLGVVSCSVFTFDSRTSELVMVASLDVPQEMVSTVRLRLGEGVLGRAVQERRPMQSPDLWSDPRQKYPHLTRTGGFRSMLSVPLLIGEEAVGGV